VKEEKARGKSIAVAAMATAELGQQCVRARQRLGRSFIVGDGRL
jgi:hypothetical protein